MRFSDRTASANLCAYLLLAAMLTGCDRPASGPQPLASFKDARIVAVGWTADDPQWPGIRGGIERAAADFAPLRVEFRAARDALPATYAALIADVERTRPHVAILHVGRARDVEHAVRRLAHTGVRVVTVGRSLVSEGEYARVEVDLPGAAELLGAELPRIADGGQAYVLLHGRGIDDEATRLYQRFSAGAEKNRLISRIAERTRLTADSDGREQIGEMLAEFRNVSLVITLDDRPWRGGTAGLLGPGNRFATLPASPVLWGEMRAGRCAGLAGPLDGDAGAAALNLAVHALSNSPRPESPRVIPCELVTPDTLDDFARRYRAAAGAAAGP